MTHIEFQHLHECDLIRDANGRGYTVLHVGKDYVLAQNTVKIPLVHAERWKMNARLTNCREVPVPRPPNFTMHEGVIKAGFSYVERKEGKHYEKSCGGRFTLEEAWDSIQPKEKIHPMEAEYLKHLALMFPKTLIELHDQLRAGGWIPDEQNRPYWTGPSGQRAAGAKEAWELMKGIL